MTITQHRILSWSLGLLSVVLLVALLVTLGRANRYRVDVRYAHDIIGGFDSMRDLGMKGELSETIAFPRGPAFTIHRFTFLFRRDPAATSCP